MDEQQTLADRARAAWREAEQEQRVEAERRKMERLLALVKDAKEAVERLYDPVTYGTPRITAGEPYVGDGYYGAVTLYVDDLALHYSVDEDGTRRLRLRSDCLGCGGMVLFTGGFVSISSVTGLGAAMAERDRNPRGDHVCPDGNVWEGNMTLGAAMAKTDDPALVLLDAMQGYVHAAVEAAIEGKSWVNDDEVIPLTPAWAEDADKVGRKEF